MMTGADWWAVVMFTIAGVCLGLRGFMLKPTLAKWVSAPTAVWFLVLVLAIVCGGAVMSILGGAHALGREVVVATALAVCSSVMLINLSRQQAETDVLTRIMVHLDEAARLAVKAAVDEVRRVRGRLS